MVNRVMIVAGEASGDLHGSGVVRALKKRQPAIEVYGIGGDKMREAGMELIFHIRQTSVMGIWEVLGHLPFIRRVFRRMDEVLHSRRPDVVILIDYPGFNLKFARLAKQLGVRVIYYISPQVWAWGKKRVMDIKCVIDKMLVVFPFEVEIYRKAGVSVEFVGHPLLDAIRLPKQDNRSQFCRTHGLDENKKIVALFPGSRTLEVTRLSPTMAKVGSELKKRLGVEIGVGVAAGMPIRLYDKYRTPDEMKLVMDDTYNLMRYADLAIVKSGTATLEIAYFGTPMIVVYKTSIITYLVYRALMLDVKHIGMANIIAGKQIVPELIQARATVKNIVSEAARLLGDEKLRNETRAELMKVIGQLGTPGASERVAEAVING
jgi:lipid-A-disaccharide synthase